MSITDELRGYAQDWRENPNLMDDLDAGDVDGILADLEHIADRIDAEHEKAVRETGEDIVLDVRREWVRLPVDADGVPIRVGERVQLIGNDPSTVSHMSLADGGWRVYVKYDGGIGTGNGEPKFIRHHHAPTVEDVLRQVIACANNGTHVHGALDTEQIVAEYAAKLRLAEGEDA